jgi:dipeptidyl aminopeptidase/acylaminoacyl peptidase
VTDTGPFADITAFNRLARIGDLQMSPDGKRLVATVSMLSDDGAKRVDSLWELDPNGVHAARRLTWSDRGETSPRWLPDGSLVFLSARGKDDDQAPSALWVLPAAGEARQLLDRPGGVSAIEVASAAPLVVAASPTMPSATDSETDEQMRKERKDRKVSGVLHETSPVRFWDQDLGPGQLRLFALSVPESGNAESDDAARELTPTPGRALDDQSFVVSPDGATVVSGWGIDDEPGLPRPQLVVIDTTTGQRRVLASDPHARYGDAAFSPDGRSVACVRVTDSDYEEAPRPMLWLIDVAGGEGREVAADADLWPAGRPVWAPDGSALYFSSDHQGHGPIFRVDLRSDQVTKVTRSGHYAAVSVSPDGAHLFALRDHIDSPPTPVRIDARGVDVDPDVVIPTPAATAVPGRLEELTVVVEDGTSVHAWLALPESASADAPAPLLLWIHGGPLSSWNFWSWRWNPWLMIEKGYAVLLPDPALSTGYGRAMVQRGWGQWGGSPYADLMAVTDDVVKRPDIDETRTAAMGGSYGGYMANWVAGHTGRFRCIVTHASLWALDQFQGTTDHPAYWAREWGLPDTRPARYEQWSPHLFADHISSPMLVIHGDKDYRVPVGEGLRLWWDLQRRTVPSKFLYFPDEGHWIGKPGNVAVWYETVWAWLATHVLDEPWERPALL